MLNLLRTALRQGRQTIAFPDGVAPFPERFRGRPVVRCSGCEGRECIEVSESAPTSLIRAESTGRAVLDLGACLFSPEEAAASAECGVSFGGDYRMAVRSRSALQTRDGEVELAAALDSRMRALLGRSLRLRSVSAGSCNGCEAELVALGNVVFDMARFGIQFVASPRHADGIVITGAVSRNMTEALMRTYEAVPDPRIVIAVGACALSGGPFRGGSQVMNGVPEGLPVDLHIPGCPPHPLTVLDGLLRLLGRLDG
jgi:Ni,Fe-hydrogenase III small subunit